MNRVRHGLAIGLAGLLALLIYRSFSSEALPAKSVAVNEIPAAQVPAAAVMTPALVTQTEPDSKPVVEHGAKPRVVNRAWTPIKHYPNTTAAMNALLPLAQAGDTKAMIGIALAIQECRLEPPNEEEMRWSRKLGAQSGHPIDDEDEDRIKKYTSAFNHYCTLPHDQIFGQYRNWLLKAADAGDSEAQLIASIFPPIDPDFKKKMMESARRADGTYYDLLGGETRTLGIKYAQMAMEQGEVRAILQLRSYEYSAPEDQKSPTQFYMYNWLMSQIPERDGTDGGWKKQLEWAGKNLRPIDEELAVERGQAVLAKSPEWIWRPSPQTLLKDPSIVPSP